MNHRKIIVPSGIGDGVWLLMKLINAHEKFHFILPGGQPRRGKQMFDLLPEVAISSEYSNRPLSYRKIEQYNIQEKYQHFYKIKFDSFHLSANKWLESGKRLEKFFPDLETSFTLPWQTSDYKQDVEYDINHFVFLNCPLIGIYGSSYSTSRAWNFWQEKEWLELIGLIHKAQPRCVFCLIGAEWDMDLNTGLVKALTEAKIDFLNTVGRPLGYVMELMKRLDYAFYFPSGLPIISETLSARTASTMFYPRHLERMMGAWCEPKRRNSGEFKECLFCTPQAIFEWVRDIYHLFDKIKK